MCFDMIHEHNEQRNSDIICFIHYISFLIFQLYIQLHTHPHTRMRSHTEEISADEGCKSSMSRTLHNFFQEFYFIIIQYL